MTFRMSYKDNTTSSVHTLYCCRGKKLLCNAEVSPVWLNTHARA